MIKLKNIIILILIYPIGSVYSQNYQIKKTKDKICISYDLMDKITIKLLDRQYLKENELILSKKIMNLESSILIKNNQIKSIDNIVNMQKININRYKDIIKRNEETIQSISNKNKTNKKIFFILGLSLGCAAYFF